jgi:hypothetical protein
MVRRPLSLPKLATYIAAAFWSIRIVLPGWATMALVFIIHFSFRFRLFSEVPFS